MHRRCIALCVPFTTGAFAGTLGCDNVADPKVVQASVSETRVVASDSGKIRLKYVCGNQFRIRNFGADTTTVTWEIRGTKASPGERGSLRLRGRDTAAFSDTTFTTQQTGAVQLYAAGKLIQTKGKERHVCRDKSKLTIITERGVVETHGLRDREYQTGKVVSYAFQAKKGFQNVLVTLDGVYVPATGTVTMSEDHLFIASADSVVKLTAQEQGVANAIREVVTGQNPVAAYQALVNKLSGLADGSTFDALMQRAAYVAYDPITDSAALRRADEILANHVFLVTNTGGSASTSAVSTPRNARMYSSTTRSVTRPSVRRSMDVDNGSARDSLEPTTFMYVNGIFTSPEKSAQTLVHLTNVLRQVPRFRNTPFTMAHFYNRSMMRQYESPSDRKAACGAALKARMSFLGSRSWAPFLKRCYTEHSEMPPIDNDVTEALTQYAQLLLHLPVNAADAEVLADTLHQYRTRGRHLILVPHSQGNMMVQQAANVLRSTYEYSELRDSVGIAVVALAAPTSSAWPFPRERVKPITIQGDIIPLLGGSTFPRITTAQSTELLGEVDGLSKIAPGNPFTSSYVVMRRAAVGIQLHEVDGSYLQGSAAAAVRDSAASSYREIAAGELTFALSSDQLMVGQGRNLPLYMTVYNQNDLSTHKTVPLKGRNIAWRSTNAAAAAVDDGGRVTGVGGGSATVWARTWGDSAPVAFTVQGISTTLTGTYSGFWETLDYALPYFKEPAAMTLVVNGMSITGNITWTSGGRSYNSKILNGTVDPFGHAATFTLQGPDPEAVWLGKRCIGDPNISTPNGNMNTGGGGVDCYQVISVHLSGTDLNGTSYGVGPVWSRSWWLQRAQ